MEKPCQPYHSDYQPGCVICDRWRELTGASTGGVVPPQRPPIIKVCPNRRPDSKTIDCPTCNGSVQIKVYACSAHPEGCTVGREMAGYHLCDGKVPERTPPVNHWAVGITTVPRRRNTSLPKTLDSLRRGGFENPTLFVDGTEDQASYMAEFRLPVVARSQPLRVYGNWVLALAELYLRHPDPNYRFALFQDDLISSTNLRTYLDRIPHPHRGYLNLYTAPSNEDVCPPGRQGFYESRLIGGGAPELRLQSGKGALALVFDYWGVRALLTEVGPGLQHLIDKPIDPHRGWRNLDGAVVTAMNKVGFREYVHNPSLVQHVGQHSSIGNEFRAVSHTFRGEDFDCLSLLSQEVSHV